MEKASSMMPVAMASAEETMPEMLLGRLPESSASSRLTISVASPTDSAAMIDAIIGWT